MNIAEQIRKEKQEVKSAFAKRLLDAQAECLHLNVAHWSGDSAYSLMHPHRICMDCGVEEEGGWWCYSVDCSHWHARNDVYGTILGQRNNREFKEVSFDDLMRLRV